MEYWLYDDTLHLGVALLDAAMTSELHFERSETQLVGVACLVRNPSSEGHEESVRG